MTVQAGKLDSVLHAIRCQAIPAFQALPGCLDISVLVDGHTVVFLTEWELREQATGATHAKYRVAALERIRPDLSGPPDTHVYRITARA